MYNPFMKRATEYLRDDRSFLAAVSPEPLITYFAKPAAEDRLYDRLAVIIGTPGSGKTTIARLFQVSTLLTLSQNEGMDFFQSLMDAMRACGATKDGLPCVAGTRIPLETEYREIWQFPYSEEVRFGILTTLIQARAMLGWIKGFTDSGIPIGDISITTKSTAEAAVHFIGGKNGAGLLERAKQVEKAIYQVSSALVPPKLTGGDDELSKSLSSYRPFDVLESFTIAGRPLSLKPLVILDDAHSLHYAQFASMHRWLARRELAISRWMLTRIDSLNPEDVLSLSSENPNSDVKRSREITQVLFQGTGDRIAHRKAFRKMAKDMAGRYLQLMEVFSRHHIADMSSLLLSDEPILSGSKLDKLQSDTATLKNKNKITDQRFGQIENVVDEYLRKNDSVRPDVRLGMIYILLNRYINRTESAGQQSIFSEDVISDPEPSRPIEAGPDIASGARIQLSHKYDRPYYFGIDALCDASSENAEQFLHLASSLVARAETQLIRGKKAPLSVSDQHNILTERAKKIIDEWSFPYHKEVRGLVAVVTQKALSRSLEPTAPLGAGACGIGILQDEFLQIPERHPELARVLKFAIAYSALFINTGVLVKRKTWCVIELGGIPLVASGLTLSRGGFVQDNTKTLLRVLEPQS